MILLYISNNKQAQENGDSLREVFFKKKIRKVYGR